MILYHRTLVSLARGIVKEGFGDEKWRFGDDENTGQMLSAEGVWLTDRPVDLEDGPPGAAVLEVEIDLDEESLTGFEIHGVLEGVRLFVVPAATVNPRSRIRIAAVDARSSWFHERVDRGRNRGAVATP
ncbi:MAG: hypothetical protein EXR93_01855 [Gemmatimonadetes bacterium]|nr:hypothetical protein [Gemmatimonadota bacterium]